MVKTLGKIALLGLMLTSVKPLDANPSWAIGISENQLIPAVKAEYNFNDYFGVQGTFGCFFSTFDFTLNFKNFYGYLGVLGESPLAPLVVTEDFDPVSCPSTSANFGVGWESNYKKKGLNFGAEIGLCLPFQRTEETSQDSFKFKLDLFLDYRFPIKKK